MHRTRTLLLLALAACSRRESDAPLAPLDGTAPPVPRLVFEQEWAPPLDVDPIPFGMGPGPTFLVRMREGGDHAMAWIGPDREPLAFAGVGDGPGEVRGAALMAIQDSALAVFDFSNNRIAWWDTNGTFLRQVRLGELPLMFGPSRPGEWLGARIGAEGLIPVAIALDNGRIRSLVGRNDSFLMAEFGSVEEDEPRLGSTGRWDGGFLSVRGQTYRIAGYDWNGRRRFVIAPDVGVNHYGPRGLERTLASLGAVRGRSATTARQRERLARQPLQWFSHLAPPRVDHKGRIWIVGSKGDSVFADAWWRGRYLGRTMLECLDSWGRWNLSGDRIALACVPAPQDSVQDWVYRIWRIEDDSIP